MYGNYNNYYQPQAQQQLPQRQPSQQIPMMPQQIGLKGRPVSSIEEVRASAIDFDGSVFFFPDLANKHIYTKQIGMDGTAVLNMYELKEIPREVPTTSVNMAGYITREEFDNTMTQIKDMLEAVKQQPHPAEQQKQFNF